MVTLFLFSPLLFLLLDVSFAVILEQYQKLFQKQSTRWGAVAEVRGLSAASPLDLFDSLICLCCC